MNLPTGFRAFMAAAAVLTLGSNIVAAQSGNPFRAAPPDVEDALKARIAQFYDYFQQAKFRDAEAMVVEESKDAFYNAKKARIFGYEIRSMKFSEDLKEANVLVTCLSIVPQLGAKPMPVPLPSRWKFIDGDWYLFFETRQIGDVHDSPAGKMHFSQELGTPGSLANVQPVTLAALKDMYAVSTSSMTVSSQASEPATRTFQVENRSKGELTLETESKGMPGVTVELGDGKIAADDSLTVSVTFVPSRHVPPGEYSLQFTVQPLAQHFEVKLLVE